MTKQHTFHASSKSTGKTIYRFFRTAGTMVSHFHLSLIRWTHCLPWRPAACTMEVISAEESRSGRETSTKGVSISTLFYSSTTHNPPGRHQAPGSSCSLLSGK